MPSPSDAVSLPVVVDAGSGVAPFEQLRAQVTALVEEGRLSPGDRLPPVRALAGMLGLAANTVARAYKELEADGVVTTNGRAGTTVAAGEHAARVAVEREAAAFVRLARGCGLSDAETLALVRDAQRA